MQNPPERAHGAHFSFNQISSQSLGDLTDGAPGLSPKVEKAEIALVVRLPPREGLPRANRGLPLPESLLRTESMCAVPDMGCSL